MPELAAGVGGGRLGPGRDQQAGLGRPIGAPAAAFGRLRGAQLGIAEAERGGGGKREGVGEAALEGSGFDAFQRL